MDAYLIPLKSAVLVFFVLANVITIPYLFWEYRRKGALTVFKALVIYSFVFYLMAAFFMTLLPLPTKEFVASLTGPYVQLVPFMFVQDIVRETVFRISQPSTYFAALTQHVFLQVLFNVVLTIPFGVYLRYYFKKDFKQVLFLSFLMSLFYEVTQITGVYGIYPRPYRLFDVDDLIMNTLGGLVGYWMTPALVFMFPTREEIETKISHEAKRVPFLRRVFAYSIDFSIVNTIYGLTLGRSLKNPYLMAIIVAVILGLLYYFMKGETLGLRLLKLKIVSSEGENLNLIQGLSRALLFSGIYMIGFRASMDFFDYLNTGHFEYRYVFLFYIILMLSVQLILMIHVFIAGVIRHKPLIYEALSHTQIESKL